MRFLTLYVVSLKDSWGFWVSINKKSLHGSYLMKSEIPLRNCKLSAVFPRASLGLLFPVCNLSFVACQCSRKYLGYAVIRFCCEKVWEEAFLIPHLLVLRVFMSFFSSPPHCLWILWSLHSWSLPHCLGFGLIWFCGGSSVKAIMLLGGLLDVRMKILGNWERTTLFITTVVSLWSLE